jgi:NADPH:quinone reductase-like Zn-dependent oxidoreductase
MRAFRSNGQVGLEALTMVDLPDPGMPGPGIIRVRLHATSINFHDLGVVTGRMRAAPGRIPMADGAGVVEAIGDGISGFVVGDRVVSTFFPQWLDGEPPVSDFATTPGDGVDGYARDYVLAPETAFTRAPAGYSHAEAATLTTAAVTAWRALVVNGGIQANETVLVLGTGGVAIFALQFAKALGATVIVTSSDDGKLERARLLGADHGINYRHVADWGQAVQQITNGRGVDHVVETGGVGTLGQSMQAARIGGHLALIGVLTGTVGPFTAGVLMARQQRLQGLVVGSRRHQIDMVRAIDAHGLKPVIDQSFSFEHLSNAFRARVAGSHFGKIVVEY